MTLTPLDALGIYAAWWLVSRVVYRRKWADGKVAAKVSQYHSARVAGWFAQGLRGGQFHGVCYAQSARTGRAAADAWLADYIARRKRM